VDSLPLAYRGALALSAVSLVTACADASLFDLVATRA
jgi:hypothetical protein